MHLLQDEELKGDGVARLLVDIAQEKFYWLDTEEGHKECAETQLRKDYRGQWRSHQPEMVGTLVSTTDEDVDVSIGRSSHELKPVHHTPTQLRVAKRMMGTIVRRAYPGRKIKYEVNGL